MLEHPPSILVVDDNDAVLETIRALLKEGGFGVATAATGWEALHLVAVRHFDLAVVDIHLGGDFDGMDLVQYVRLRQPGLRALFISGLNQPVTDDPDRDDFVFKPFRPQELLGCIWELLQRKVPKAALDVDYVHAKREILENKIDCLRNQHRRADDDADEPTGVKPAEIRRASGRGR